MVLRFLRPLGVSVYCLPRTSTTLRFTSMTRCLASICPIVRAYSSPCRSPEYAAVLAISSSRSPRRPWARALPRRSTSASAGISDGSTYWAVSPATLASGSGTARPPACHQTSRSRGLTRYPASSPALTSADRHRRTRAPPPLGRGNVHDLLRVADSDVLAGDGGDDWRREPLAQPPLGIGMAAGPRLAAPGTPARRQ